MQYNQCAPRKRTWVESNDEQYYSDAIKTPRFEDIEYVSVDVFKTTAKEEPKDVTISTDELLKWCETTPMDLISLLSFDTFKAEVGCGVHTSSSQRIPSNSDTDCILPQDFFDGFCDETERIDTLVNHKLVDEVVMKKERDVKMEYTPNKLKFENPQEYEMLKNRVIRCIGVSGMISLNRLQYSLKKQYKLLWDIVQELIAENIVTRPVNRYGRNSAQYVLNKRFI
jgi:hypothetical protein